MVIISVCSPWRTYWQSKSPTNTEKTTATVPFIGCASDGQTGPVNAPAGQARHLPTSTETAAHLAYYASAQKLGVLAPRGWFCFGTYGSNGAALYVSPQPFDAKNVLSAKWRGFSGPAIELSLNSGETSGRFAVAHVIARVFPTRKAFADGVISEGIEPASSFAFGPYPADQLVYKSKDLVEYRTPARADGLGTQSRLQKNDAPISGVAILTGEAPDVVFLAVRLPLDLQQLSQGIVEQVERDIAIANP